MEEGILTAGGLQGHQSPLAGSTTGTYNTGARAGVTGTSPEPDSWDPFSKSHFLLEFTRFLSQTCHADPFYSEQIPRQIG